MIPLFLGALAGLGVASWVGMVLMELDSWSGGPMLLAALVAFLLTTWLTRSRFGERGWLVPGLALLVTLSVLPGIDTSLMSQDASLYQASGRHLAREGTIRVEDPRLASMDAVERAALFPLGSFSTFRVSFSRIPGGLVVPDETATAAIPSFSHLLIVWIAFADWCGGMSGILLLGPLFAFLSLWAIGLLAQDQAGWLGATAALMLLASWMPQNYFSRFLMPEILTQALIWGGVLAARLTRDERERAAEWPLGVLCGLALGVSAMARLEQIFIFVPALCLARAVLPIRIRVLPRFAAVVFALGVLQAVFDLLILPTDPSNRILKVLAQAYAVPIQAVFYLVDNDGYAAIPILRYGLPSAILLGIIGVVVLVRRLEVRRHGLGIRTLAGLIGGASLVLLFMATGQGDQPVLNALGWYLPKILWIPFLLGAPGFLSMGGLEVALVLLSLDQVVAGRVTAEQIWAARRLVATTLPVLALMAASALAARSRAVVRVAGFLIVLGVLWAAPMLRPMLGQPVQQGGQTLASEIAATVPSDALLVLARELDWTHLAAAVWMGEGGPSTLVVRESEVTEHRPALRQLMREESKLFYLAGRLDSDQVDGLTTEEEALLQGWKRTLVRTWQPVLTRLQPEIKGPPTRIQTFHGRLELYRLEPIGVS